MSISTKEQAVSDAEAALRRAKLELALAKSRRQAEPAPGAHIRIFVVFPSSRTSYTYLAYRPQKNGTNGEPNWYVTGQAGAITWDTLMSRVERGDFEVQELRFH